MTSHGVRFELMLRQGEGVRYEVELQGASTRWTGLATVSTTDGAVQLDPFQPDEPPAWTLTTLRAFLRSEWRARRDDPELAWPRRITRWRAER